MHFPRVLCGWVNHHGAVDFPDAHETMLQKSGVSSEDLVTHRTPNLTLAVSKCTGSIAAVEERGCVAAVIGRPRWIKPSIAKIASEGGNAVAALACYEHKGLAVLDEMAGSFTLVICDTKRRQTLLAVDRSGITRLCFANNDSNLVFSTSATAVAKHPSVAAQLNSQALFEYLYFHAVPSPDTIFLGVEKLLPAEMALVTETDVERSFYWTLPYSPPISQISESTQKRKLKELLRQSVDRQIGEEATGAFLSGGTDSSTIAGILGDVTGRPAHTFSIGFSAEGFDEIDYARITARHFGAISHELYVTQDHVAEAIPVIAAAYDEPFGNASAVPTYFCAKLAHEHGIQVMLAGDGGDEFFGGNARYAKQRAFEHYWRLPKFLRTKLESTLLALPDDIAPAILRKARSYVDQAKIPLPDRLETYNFLHRTPLESIFHPDFLAMIDVERPLELMRETYRRSPSPELVDQMMFLDHKFTLADNDLRKVSRMCEIAGVEARFPFLDEDLISFTGTLSGRQKVFGQRLRPFFKDALSDYLPKATITKSKHGFGLPFGQWLSQEGELRAFTNQTMQSLACRGIVRPNYLEALLDSHRNEHATYYGVMIWVLLQLELWLQRNV